MDHGLRPWSRKGPDHWVGVDPETVICGDPMSRGVVGWGCFPHWVILGAFQLMEAEGWVPCSLKGGCGQRCLGNR